MFLWLDQINQRVDGNGSENRDKCSLIPHFSPMKQLNQYIGGSQPLSILDSIRALYPPKKCIQEVDVPDECENGDSIAYTFHRLDNDLPFWKSATRFDIASKEIEELKKKTSLPIHYRLPLEILDSSSLSLIYRLHKLLRGNDQLYVQVNVNQGHGTLQETRKTLRSFFSSYATKCLGNIHKEHNPISFCESSALAKILFTLPYQEIKGTNLCIMSLEDLDSLIRLIQDLGVLGFESGFCCSRQLFFEVCALKAIERRISLEYCIDQDFPELSQEICRFQEVLSLLYRIEAGGESKVYELVNLLSITHQDLRGGRIIPEFVGLPVYEEVLKRGKMIAEKEIKRRGEKIPHVLSEI